MALLANPLPVDRTDVNTQLVRSYLRGGTGAEFAAQDSEDYTEVIFFTDRSPAQLRIQREVMEQDQSHQLVHRMSRWVLDHLLAGASVRVLHDRAETMSTR